MSKLATFWTGDLSAGFPTVRDVTDEVSGQMTRKAMLRNIEQTLSARWGGVTITRVRGAWWEGEHLLREYGYKFEVYFTSQQHVQLIEDYDGDWVEAIKADARYIAGVLRQEEVHVTISDILFFNVKPTPHTGPSRLDA